MRKETSEMMFQRIFVELPLTASNFIRYYFLWEKKSSRNLLY